MIGSRRRAAPPDSSIVCTEAVKDVPSTKRTMTAEEPFLSDNTRCWRTGSSLDNQGAEASNEPNTGVSAAAASSVANCRKNLAPPCIDIPLEDDLTIGRYPVPPTDLSAHAGDAYASHAGKNLRKTSDGRPRGAQVSSRLLRAQMLGSLLDERRFIAGASIRAQHGHHDGRTQRLYQAQPDKKTTAKFVTGEIAKRNEQNE